MGYSKKHLLVNIPIKVGITLEHFINYLVG